MQVDHIKPIARGQSAEFRKTYSNELGTDKFENYNPSCRMCNFRKGMLTVDEFRKALERMPGVISRNFTYRMMLKYRIIALVGTFGSEIATPRITFHFENPENIRKELEYINRINNGEKQ